LEAAVNKYLIDHGKALMSMDPKDALTFARAGLK